MYFYSIFAVLLSYRTNVLTYELPNLFEMVDMTYTFDNSTLYYPTEKKFELVLEHNGTVEDGYWFQSERYSSGVHVGTHMDAPCHFAKGRWCVDQIPLDHLVAPAAVIEIIQKASKNRDCLVKVEDLLNWERVSGRSLDGTIVMLRSGWGRRWPDREAFTGTSGYDTTKLHFPGMSKEASQWLAEERSIYGLGTDALSVDHGPTQELMAHRTLLGANIFVLENVANMEKIPIYGSTLFVMPMKIGNGSGAPVRILAIFPKHILMQ